LADDPRVGSVEEPGPTPNHVRARPRFFLPRRRRDIIVLLVAGAVLGISALPIDENDVGPLETSIFHAINGLPDALYWPTWILMQFGNLVAVPVTAVAALVARRVRLAVDLVLAGGAAWILAKVVKDLVFRPRPGNLLEDTILRHAPAGGHGFVAGHSATACALAAAAWPYLPRPARWAVVGLAAVVCFGRIYVGAHLPLDVVGGAALGAMCGSVVHLLLGAPGPGSGPRSP
jgi:undecaprenyl-diphosphatase